MKIYHAKFSVGQLVVHKLFNYRGIVYDVDPGFLGSNEWYTKVALSCPPKDEPWYKVLVHNAFHETYVAERNLMPDTIIEAINHPLIETFFECCEDGKYTPTQRQN